MGVRSEHRLRLLRVDHRRDLRRLVAWMKASTGTSRIDARGNNRRGQSLDFLARQFESWGLPRTTRHLPVLVQHRDAVNRARRILPTASPTSYASGGPNFAA